MKADINGVSIAYDDTGSGPALLLIHGFPLCRRMWRPQGKALARAGYRVIAPDLRGFGESSISDGAVAMETYADDMIGLLDRLGIERAVVGGMSMGGYVLMNLLERYPDRVPAAVFIVTKAGADDAAAKAKRTALAESVMREGAKAASGAFRGVLFAAETLEKRPELVDEVSSWMDATGQAGLAAGLIAMRERKDSVPLLPRFSLPAMVIGAEGDMAIPPENSRLIASGLSGAELCIIHGGGHMVNLEQPEAFNETVLDFLKGL